mmetsp:Transcript_43115/g.91733  ORF Transcript_43115/g.91733 Transcript_43115/m.91733 type:complete len:465 (-) Transcript_43115:443-1837(-)
MRDGSKPAQIEVPPIIVNVQIELLHLFHEDIQSFLPLTSANKLADPGHEEIHCVHSLASVLVIIPHVKCLDRLGVIVNEDSALKFCLRQPPLMLRRQVSPKLHLRELPLGGILRDLLLQVLDGIPVRHPHEWLVRELLQPLLQPLVEKLREESQVLVALLERHAHHALQHRLGVVHRARQVREGHLRLDHPELREVPRRLTVLGAERRAEGVHVPQGAGVSLPPQLAGDGEEGGLAEEVLPVVYAGELLPVLVLRAGQGGHVVDVEGGHAEHLPGPLAVRGGDEGGLDVPEPLLLKERVDGPGERRADAGHSSEGVRTRTEVGDGAEVLEGVTLLGQGVGFGRARAHDAEGSGRELDGLLTPLGFYYLASGVDGASRGEFVDLLQSFLVHFVEGQHTLNPAHARSVVHLHERQRLLLSYRPHPALDGHKFLRHFGVDGFDPTRRRGGASAGGRFHGADFGAGHS